MSIILLFLLASQDPLWVRDPRQFGYYVAFSVLIFLAALLLAMFLHGRREIRKR